jgi:hypothetical protein
MVWLYIAVWLLAAGSSYAALDVLAGEREVLTGRSKRGGSGEARRALWFGVAAALLVLAGASVPVGAASCLLLGTGLGAATYGLLPILGLEEQPAWVRAGNRKAPRRG